MELFIGQPSEHVFRFFEEISQIPHGSYHEEQICKHLVDFAQKRGLEVYSDDLFNVVIKKDGTEDLKNAPTIVLQGHIDMVCEKNSNVMHDFATEPIKLIVEGDVLRADGTTLGADNGIAVAMMLALLDSDSISHPRLECLFTSQEEVGLNGAQAINPDWIDGKYMVNIDSEEYGNFLVSCAGGAVAELLLPTGWTIVDGDFCIRRLQISGLKGGHSGINIIEERGNANKLLGRLLSALANELAFEIQTISGGSKDNAIPRESYADIVLSPDKVPQLQEFVDRWIAVINSELRGKDTPIQVQCLPVDTEKTTVYNDVTKTRVLHILSTVPNGVYTMSFDIKNLVESSKNLGVIVQEQAFTRFTFSIRSSVESLLQLQIDQLQSLADLLGGELKVSGRYPGWEYSPESPLRDLLVRVFHTLEGKDPLVSAIHAGLECGILKQKLGDVDIVSLGPDIFNPHSPDERASIQSIDRTYHLLLEFLKRASEL